MKIQSYLPATLLTLFCCFTPARAEGPTVLLEKGIYTEETVGDLDAAIQIYKQIVDREEMRRPVVAQAMYRLGECYLKKGDMNRAAVAFDDLKVRFPDQKELVAKAQRKLASTRQNLSETQVGNIIRTAVMSISTRPEGDPQVNTAVGTLQGLNPAIAVKALTPYLSSDDANIRRSAIYILWKGSFDNIDPAVEPLKKLCSHAEEFTRGMAAIALGVNRIDSSFDLLTELTLNDKSGYARRCAAYALGLLGRSDAKDVLTKAVKDTDPGVQANAQAALTMLAQASRPADAGDSRGRSSSDRSRGGTVRERKVGKPISAFPDKVDLSTPESACAAYHRASARMDAKEVVELSWVKIDPKELESGWRRADKADIDVYNRAQRDATIEEVLQSGDDLAQVISLLKFPEGVGRHPYSARCFGLIDGKWKNIGEDRCPSLEAARANFREKKDRLQDHFDEITHTRTATRPAAPPNSADRRKAEVLSVEGWRLCEQGKYKEAQDLFEQSAALDPTDANTWDGLGWSQFYQSQPLNAQASFEKCLAIQPTHAGALNGLGWSQFNQGQPLNARYSFEKCLAIQPTHAGALNGLGWIDKNAGKTGEAIEYWKKAVEAAPAATAALRGLANTYLETKKYEEAIKYYHMWLKAEPDNTEAKQKLDEAVAGSKHE